MRRFLAIGAVAAALIVTGARAQEADEEPVVTAAQPAYVGTDESQPEPTVPVMVAQPAFEPTLEPTVMPLPAPTAPTSAPVLGNKIAAAVVDNRFQPNSLSISVGSTVTWTNNGNNIHTLTSPDGLFDSGGLIGGQSFSFTFDKAGTFRLICRQHGLNGMAGQITVQ